MLDTGDSITNQYTKYITFYEAFYLMANCDEGELRFNLPIHFMSRVTGTRVWILIEVNGCVSLVDFRSPRWSHAVQVESRLVSGVEVMSA